MLCSAATLRMRKHTDVRTHTRSFCVLWITVKSMHRARPEKPEYYPMKPLLCVQLLFYALTRYERLCCE